MPRFYKKGALGRMIEAEGGSSDPELAEVRMTEEEYHGMVDRIISAKKDAESARADAVDRIKAVKRSAQEEATGYKRQMEADADKRVSAAQASARRSEEEASSLREQLSQMTADLRNEQNLNRNLLRIMKERANQARGIKPKKERDGYVVLESRQWTERYTEDVWDTEEHKKQYDNSNDRKSAIYNGFLRIDHKTAEVWRSVVQTPYNASLPIKQILNLIEEEISAVLADIGVETRLKTEYNGTYYNFGIHDDGHEKNGMYRWKYKSNFRVGLWELEIFTTKSLRVPEHRRPSQRTRG